MFGTFGIRPHPDAVVDHPADMLGELAVDRRPDRADRLIEQHRDRQARSTRPRAGNPVDCRTRAAQCRHSRQPTQDRPPLHLTLPLPWDKIPIFLSIYDKIGILSHEHGQQDALRTASSARTQFRNRRAQADSSVVSSWVSQRTTSESLMGSQALVSIGR